ncbi:MAG: polymer-forming cytoskeletal protein [Candidatus Hydrogenedentes bacterium]|nr:polymer-forming cytoskeletal protein [Candidatus Hydrogenedentota bacterium]
MPTDQTPDQNNLQTEVEQDFAELEKAGKRGLLGRFNTRFNDALQNSRGTERQRDAVKEIAESPNVSADDLAIRRARNVSLQKMVIPEGVIIEGSLTGGSDTEISGKIEGNITVEGRLFLGASALVSGNVRAGSCQVEGLVEGRVECSDTLELSKSGRLNADVIAGKRINIAGQVYGNVTTPGVLRLAEGGRIEGDVRTRSLTMEEGATLNGLCAMRAPAQRSAK